MDNFRALPKLNEKLEEMVANGQARIAKVVGVYGSEVEVEMTGGARARYATTQTSVPIGQPGIIVSGFGNTGIFIPLHMSNPVGKHWYDRGDGIQIGSVDPSAIDSEASSFVAIGSGPTITGSESVAIGIGASSGWRGISIGSEAVNDGGHSIAIGRATVSTGSSVSIAIGHFTEATASYSIAQGYSAKATGTYDVAIGRLTTASGSNSVAIGVSTSSSGLRGIGIGDRADASGERSIAIGAVVTATNVGSVAVGNSANAPGYGATALGIGAQATAGYAVAIGTASNAGYGTGTSYGEVAIGLQASAKHARGVAIGYQAATTRHYEGRIKANALIIDPSSGRAYSKLGLYNTAGTLQYIYLNSAGDVMVNSSF